MYYKPMPLQTFLNLEPKRQQRIIEVCVGEFAENNYRSASLSRIIKKLKLAKGSFYRYFRSKKELYLYLIDHIISIRMENAQTLISRQQDDFFELLRENFKMKLEFDRKFPVYAAFLYNITRERNNEDLGHTYMGIKKHFVQMVAEFLKEYQRRKKIRSDVGLDFMAYIIVDVQTGIHDYLFMKYNISFNSRTRNKQPLHLLPEKEIMKTINDFISILKSGIQR